MVHAVRKTSKITHTYSKLAAVLLRFKVIGEPNYESQTVEFSYADQLLEPYTALTDENASDRQDLLMLGHNFTQVRQEQTAKFEEVGFTRRPKAIRSVVATIVVNMRMKKSKGEKKYDEEEKKE